MLREVKPIQVYLPLATHKKLKTIAIEYDTNITEIVQELIDIYIEKFNKKGKV